MRLEGEQEVAEPRPCCSSLTRMSTKLGGRFEADLG